METEREREREIEREIERERKESECKKLKTKVTDLSGRNYATNSV